MSMYLNTLTFLQAVKGKCVLANKFIVRTGVVVLNQKAHKGQIWHTHIKLEVLIPHGVEALRNNREQLGNILILRRVPTEHIQRVIVPLFSMYCVSTTVVSAGTPQICTFTMGSTMEDFLLLTLGNCWAEITYQTNRNRTHVTCSIVTGKEKV